MKGVENAQPTTTVRAVCASTCVRASSADGTVLSQTPYIIGRLVKEESLELVFRALPEGSSGSIDDVTEIFDELLAERGVEVSTDAYTSVFSRRTCKGRKAPPIRSANAHPYICKYSIYKECSATTTPVGAKKQGEHYL